MPSVNPIETVVPGAGAQAKDLEAPAQGNVPQPITDMERTLSGGSGVQRSRSANPKDDYIVASGFEKFVVKHACCACWGFLGMGLLAVMCFVAMYVGGQVELTYESVWEVRSDLDVQKEHAFRILQQRIGGNSLQDGRAIPERSAGLNRLTIVYEVKNGNIFDPINQAKMRRVEDVLLKSPRWPDYCMLISAHDGNSTTQCTGGNSVLSYTHTGPTHQATDLENGFGPCGGDPIIADQCLAAPFTIGQQPCVSSAFNPIVQDAAMDNDYASELRCMCCASAPESGGCSEIAGTCGNDESTVLCGQTVQRAREEKRREHIGTELSCLTGEAKRAKSWYTVGKPLAGETDEEAIEATVKQWVDGDLFRNLWQVRAEVATDDFEVYFLGMFLEGQFMSRLMRDQMLGLGAFIIVFVWIWSGTGSAFLAMCGMIEIILSLPMAGFIWGAFQMKFISFFMLSIIFLILGIGADDVFVFWDAYQQSKAAISDTEEDAETKRFAWALRRARCAMLVTSFSTFCGFMACGVSPIPSMSALGIFGAFVVIFDFFMVITFFASAVVVYTRYFEKSACRPCFVLRRCIGGVCRQAGDASCVEDKLRPVERFFKNNVAVWVHRFRWPIAVFWLVLGLACLVTAAVLLRPSEEAPAFFVDVYGKRMNELTTSGFLTSANEARIQAQIVVGLDAEKPIDRSGTNYQDPTDLGTPVYDPAAVEVLRSPSGQLSLWNLCEAGRNSFGRVAKDRQCTTRIVNGVRVEDGACMTGVVCFIDWVRDYRIHVEGSTEADWHEREDLYTTLTGPAFAPGPGAWNAFNITMGFECPGGCCDVYGWYMCAMYMVRTQTGLQDFNAWKEATAWTIEGNTLKWVFVSMNTTLPLSALPYAEIVPHYIDWEAFVETNKGSLDGAWQTCPMWGWMVTQREILVAVFQSIGACLALAWLILCIATTNWMISSIALTCILVILFLCGGVITMAGWALGIFEAIGLIIVVGLAVDYSVHICHSYNETRYIEGAAATRFQKTQHALTEMGVSVVSGAATTFLASLFLVAATFAFYYVFGIFMLMTVIFSLLVSLTMLPALLCILGPEGERGDLTLFRKAIGQVSGKLLCCKPGKIQPSQQDAQ